MKKTLKILEKNIFFIVLIELGLTILFFMLSTNFTDKNQEFIYLLSINSGYLFLSLLLLTIGYRFNKFVNNNKYLNNRIVGITTSMISIITSTLYILLYDSNVLLSQLMAIIFYLSLYLMSVAIISAIVTSLRKKDNKHFSILIIDGIVFLITLFIIYLFNTNVLEFDLLKKIVTIFYLISSLILIIYITVVALYKAIKTN